MEFEKKLKSFRIAKGFTQQELADKTDIPLKLIKKYERGSAFPSNARLLKLAEVLEVSVRDLYTDLKPVEADIINSMFKRRLSIYISMGVTFSFLIAFILSFSFYYWNGKPSALFVIFLITVTLISLIIVDVFILTLLKVRKEKMLYGIAFNIGLIVIGVIPTSINVAVFKNQFSYSKENWMTVESGYKYYVAQDFVDRYQLKNMTVDEIKNYLGDPDSETGPDVDNLLFYSYNCGKPIRSITDKPYIFDITFKNGVVLKYTLVEH